MFRIADLIRRAWTTAARRPHTIRKPSAPRHHLRGPEWLEDRAVPAVFYWLGGGSNTFGTVGDWTLDPVNKAPAASTPGSGDEAVYDGTVSNAVCAEVGAADPFGYSYLSSIAAIRVVNGYAGVLGFPRALSVGTFQMASAAAQTDQYTDLTVTSEFDWTGGTLNLNTAAANLILSGAIATIDPGGGTLTTGDTLSFQNQAVGNVSAGTISSTNTAGLEVLSGSTLTSQDVTYVSTAANPQPIPVGSGATYDAVGVNEDRGIDVQAGGKLYIHGQKTTKFAGKSSYPAGAGVWIQQDALGLTIENGSTLDSASNAITVAGGKLATQALNVTGAQPAATIKTTLLVIGGSTTDIKISDDTLNPPGVTGHKFGTLKVVANAGAGQWIINWSAGTYRPVVDGTVGSTTADLWWASSEFVVDGQGAGAATIAPTSINNPPGGIVGRSWVVMHSETKIDWGATGAPPQFPPNSGWILDSNNGDKDWKVKYTGA